MFKYCLFFPPSSLFRNVFPEGLPPSYVFVSTQRFKVKKTWDLWRILSLDKRPQIAVTINGEEKTLSFTTTSLINGTQVITFAAPRVKVRSKSPSCWNTHLSTHYSFAFSVFLKMHGLIFDYLSFKNRWGVPYPCFQSVHSDHRCNYFTGVFYSVVSSR